MRRILLVLSLAAIMAAVMAYTVTPAFAQGCSDFGKGDVSQGAKDLRPYGINHVRALHPENGELGKLIRDEVGPNGSECSFS